MRPDHRPTPTQIIGELLRNHPEAASLLVRATHWRSLAVWSAATARRKRAAAQAARLAYEELGHLLEPRRPQLINLVVGLLLLLVLSAALVLLDLIQLGGLRSLPAALAATTVWLTGAWLGAVAARQRRWTLVAVITGAAFLLGLLLVALHSVGSYPAWPDAGTRAVFGALTGAFILVLTVGAAALMAHLSRPGCWQLGGAGTRPRPPTRRRPRPSRPMPRPPLSPGSPGWSGPGSGNHHRTGR